MRQHFNLQVDLLRRLTVPRATTHYMMVRGWDKKRARLAADNFAKDVVQRVEEFKYWDIGYKPREVDLHSPINDVAYLPSPRNHCGDDSVPVVSATLASHDGFMKGTISPHRFLPRGQCAVNKATDSW